MRATLRFSSPAPLALPKYTSSIREGSRSGVRGRSSRMAWAARSSGRTMAREPVPRRICRTESGAGGLAPDRRRTSSTRPVPRHAGAAGECAAQHGRGPGGPRGGRPGPAGLVCSPASAAAARPSKTCRRPAGKVLKFRCPQSSFNVFDHIRTLPAASGPLAQTHPSDETSANPASDPPSAHYTQNHTLTSRNSESLLEY
jgi:hypothetical protein